MSWQGVQGGGGDVVIDVEREFARLALGSGSRPPILMARG